MTDFLGRLQYTPPRGIEGLCKTLMCSSSSLTAAIVVPCAAFSARLRRECVVRSEIALSVVHLYPRRESAWCEVRLR